MSIWNENIAKRRITFFWQVVNYANSVNSKPLVNYLEITQEST